MEFTKLVTGSQGHVGENCISQGEGSGSELQQAIAHGHNWPVSKVEKKIWIEIVM